MLVTTGLLIALSWAATGYSQSGQDSDPNSRIHALAIIDRGGWLRAPGRSSGPSNREALFATYSFNDRGTVYSIEFYYRPLYNRIRARVLVGNRELHGLFNRFYGIDPTEDHGMLIYRRPDGCPLVDVSNDLRLVVKESDVNTDAIFDALEAFLGKVGPPKDGPMMYMYQEPTGLLRQTCWIHVWGARGGNYLFHADGHAEPFTLENLRRAYWQEGIQARNPADYERIGLSILTVEDEVTGHGGITTIASTEEIRQYQSHPLDTTRQSEIKAPWASESDDGQTDFWNCYTYQDYHGIVARYTFGFREGRLASLEKTILGEGIGRAVYLDGEKRPSDERK